MKTPYPVKFKPIPKRRIWGGHKLKTWFGYKGKELIGEYWVLSSHPNGTSIVTNGELKGMTLQELTDQHPKYYLGSSPQNRFPLLIKFLDITQDLSVQVHPNDEYAQKHEGDFGKTEAWYIVDTKEDGSIIFSHHFRNKEEFQRVVHEKRVKEYLNFHPIQPGQFILVPSGTLHALRADTTLIEIQQTSDVTYRVYDWDRIDSEGNQRELHIDKAGEVLSYDDCKDPFGENGEKLTCPYFIIEKRTLKKERYELPFHKTNPIILVAVKGTGLISYEKESLSLSFGNTVLCPALTQCFIETQSELELLKISYPCD